MKKSIIVILLLALFDGVIFANNVFIYLRFNPLEGDASAVVNDIDNYYRSGDSVVVYLYNPQKPMIATDNDEWADIRSKLLSIQVAEDYYAEDDTKGLFEMWNSLFKDSIGKNYCLTGLRDDKWSCVFYLSDDCYKNEAENSQLCLNILSENIKDRMGLTFKTYNTFSEIEEKPIPQSELFKY